MQAHMKTRPIKDVALMVFRGQHGVVPIYITTTETLKSNEIIHDENNSLAVEDVFGDLFKEYGKPGVLIAGLRHREGLTQLKFATILNITQANLSAMENGKRSIGKELAKRIAKKYKLDYRIFL